MRASSGGRPSASARADAQTRPPAARMSSARYRSPTRCGGGARPGLVAHAAAREERDVVAAEEPPCRLGRVAGIRVLGQQDEQPAAELLVERGEEERQHRLRDARLRRQRPRRRPGSGRGASARRRTRRAVSPAWMWSPGPCSSAGIAPRGVIVLAARRPPTAAGSRAPQPRSTTPRGTPGALMSRYRGTRDEWVTASCRDRDVLSGCALEDRRPERDGRSTNEPSDAETRAAPRRGLHGGRRPQLKRRCVSSSPSLASVSIASAARATIASTSSSGANGERT